MLGISGFETPLTSSKQKEGVFPKPFAIWIAVAVFNPLIGLLSLGFSGADIQGAPNDCSPDG